MSFIDELYTCKNLELCIIKYTCGLTSLLLLIAYSIAVRRIRLKQKSLDLDIQDRLLINLGLGECLLVLLYHIMFNHLIFLFIIRVAKMLE